MHISIARRLGVAAVLVMLLGVLAPLAALADTVTNNLDATVDGDREALSLSVGQQSTVSYSIIPAGSDGDSGLGCNFLTGNTLTLNIYILEGNVVRSPQSNAAVSTDKTQLVFTDCTTPQTITFTGVGVTGANPANGLPNFRLFFSCNNLTIGVVNSGDQSSCASAITQSGPANNQTQGRFNLAPATHDVIVTADSTAPVTTATAVTNPGGTTYVSGDWTNQNVDVTFDATDTGSGVNRIELTQTINGVTGAMTSHPDPYTLAVTTEGTTSISYQAFDNAGNAETAQTFVVNIDRTAPVTTVTALTNPGGATYTSDTWVNQNVDLTFNVDDGTGSGFAELSVTRSLNGATPTPVTIGNGGTLSITDEGTTTVTYEATDIATNQETLKTFIVKIDRTAPTITAPADVTVNATSPSGAVVTYAAPVVSDNLTTVVTNCDYPSGSLFPVGTTTVTCTATDEANNSSQASFLVTVVGADGQLDELYTMVQNTSISGTASTADSVRRTLLAQVSLAQALEGYGQTTMTCLTLTRLELDIRGQVSRRRISTRDAEALWAKIDEIQASLGCGGQTTT